MNEFTKLMVRGIAESTLNDMTAFAIEHANETGCIIKAVEGIIVLPDEKKADVRVEIIEPEDEAAYLKISFRNTKGWEISCKGELEDSKEISYVRALLEIFKILDWADRDIIVLLAQHYVREDQNNGAACYQVDVFGDDEYLRKDK